MTSNSTHDIWSDQTTHRIKNTNVTAPSILERRRGAWGFGAFEFRDADHGHVPMASMLAAANFLRNSVLNKAGDSVLRTVQQGFPECYGLIRDEDGQKIFWIECDLLTWKDDDGEVHTKSVYVRLGRPHAIKAKAFEKACNKIMAAQLWFDDNCDNFTLDEIAKIKFEDVSRRYAKKAEILSPAFPTLAVFFKSIGYDPGTGIILD